jgi:hypothetical protein
VIQKRKRQNQRGRVYAELRRWYPRECPLWALHDLKPRISDLTTRIWELRHEYHVRIDNRIEQAVGERRSFYLLARDSPEAASVFEYADVLPPLTACSPICEVRDDPLPGHGSGSLLDDISPEHDAEHDGVQR